MLLDTSVFLSMGDHLSLRGICSMCVLHLNTGGQLGPLSACHCFVQLSTSICISICRNPHFCCINDALKYNCKKRLLFFHSDDLFILPVDMATQSQNVSHSHRKLLNIGECHLMYSIGTFRVGLHIRIGLGSGIDSSFA